MKNIIDRPSDELRVVQDVKGLRNELEAKALAKFEVLDRRNIEVVDRRRLEVSAAGRGVSAEAGSDELRVRVISQIRNRVALNC